MNQALRNRLKDFFKREFADSISTKIRVGYRLSSFNINPLTLTALASGVFGSATSQNMAQALIYPRILGTSVTTTFGDKIQKMCVNLLGAEASSAEGMDISFYDKTASDAPVLCQLKAGPNTINADDVEPIVEKMRSAARLLRQNRAASMPTFAMCTAYGTEEQLSGHYRKIGSSEIGGQPNVPIYAGRDFWLRLTGDNNFYGELIKVFMEVFEGEDYHDSLELAIASLATEIETKYFTDGTLDPTKF